MNSTCGPQPKWRSYVSQLIYEQPRQHSVTNLWYGPVHNSLQVHSPSSKRLGQDCLDAFKIGVGELKLLRVQRRIFMPRTFSDPSYEKSRLELLLGSPAPNVSVRKTYKATSLQSTLLIHSNMVSYRRSSAKKLRDQTLESINLILERRASLILSMFNKMND